LGARKVRKIGFHKATVGVVRQTRLLGSEEWQSHGDVTFFQALRDRAIAESKKHGTRKWLIDVRCESDPETVDTFEVQTTIQAEVLNPRKGT
jgi:hypothetical protein